MVVRYMSTAGVTKESGHAVCSVVVVRYMSTAGVTEESGHAVCSAAVVRYILKNQVMQCAVLWLSGICLQLE